MALTKAVEQVQDWTQVAQNAVGESAILDCSGHYGTMLCIQAALDTTTAHAAGTDFIVQVSSNTSGDEDWHDLLLFNELNGTAATDLVEDNPLAATATSIAFTGHSLTALGKWLFLKDGSAIADSELVFQVGQSANAVVVLDGTTNAHAQNTPIFNIAFSRTYILPPEAVRCRLLVNNTKVAAGSTVCYKVRDTKITAVI